MKIKVSKDFSYTPGPRYEFEGPYSGESFRKEVLLPKLESGISNNEKIVVDLDGTAGFGRSFLEEAFGGLIRVERIKYFDIINHVEIISNDEPYLKLKIEEYLSKANENENS